jgi:hypothetical protein
MVQIGGTVLSSTAWVQRVVLLLLAVSLLVPAVPAVAQTSSEVAAGDADYVFTFAEDTVGEQPAYLSLPWQQTAVSVVDSGWALDGKALQIDPYDTNAFFAAVFDEVPAATNVEVLLRFRDTGTLSDVHWLTGAGARIAGGPGTETAVLSQSRDGTEGLVLARLNDGEFAGGFTEFTATQGTYLRTRWQDDVVSAKLWDGTLADEPEAWSITGHTLDDPTLDPGKVGITRYFSQHTTQIDYLTIDLLTEPEPEPVVPVVMITEGPTGTVASAGATFAFTADVDGATFECRVVEVAGWATCTSPFEVTGLTDGSYTFEVRASVDGRTGEPDSRTWTVALPAPDPDPEPQPDPAPTPTIPAGAVPLTGDWNGDGTSTPGWFVAGRWYLVPELSTGEVVSFFYGRATDLPVVGDWDGDGTDTVGVRRANQWLLRTTNTAGNANLAFAYGRASDVPVVGDWDGNGTDTVGVRRANQWLLRTTNTAGNANLAFAYGRTTDLPVVGDWDGNGTDTVGVRRANQWLLRTTNTAGNANLAFAYGRTTDLPVVGDWNGNGTDTIGIYRNGTWYLRTTNTTGNANLTY